MKLDRINHMIWKKQTLCILHSYDLDDFVHGKMLYPRNFLVEGRMDPECNYYTWHNQMIGSWQIVN